MSFNKIELPDGWLWAKIRELGEVVTGSTPLKKNPAFFGENIPFYKPTDLDAGYEVIEAREYLSELGVSQSRLLPALSVLVTCIGATIGKTGLARKPCVTNQQINAVILPKEYISPHYFFWIINSPKGQQIIIENASSTTLPIINKSRFSELTLPLPPLNEQRRIVAKIEALKARSQRVKEELEDIPQLLDQFRQSVLAAAFRGDLTADWREQNSNVEPAEALLERIRAERRRRWEEAELEKMKASGKTPKDDKWKEKYKEPARLAQDILSSYPDSWTFARAEEVCDFITKGTTPAAQKMSAQFGEVPFIKVYNLTDRGSLDFSINPTFITKDTHNGELARSKVFPGDVLMNIVGPPLGKVSIVPDDYEEWNMNQAIAVYRAMPGIENRYLCYCLLSNQILSNAVRSAKATAGQFNLTLEICRDLPLPIPSTLEQQRIVNVLERCFALADMLAEQVADAKSKHEILDQSILAKAFRGELVPQDPNDEPASVLLEHIRAERAKLQTKTAEKSTLRLGSVTTTKTSARRTKKTQPQQEESVQLDLGLE
ncbi:restriction endonuclease subunit S [Nostoc parmelioides]|uniref:Restriction endonuclease subunit S n=1 Tax=Nostoc parmelioides FACHB-3921 TaxID=2692909 RepID=A0ABR8BK39_9NOSO|nr:restriction endonuclease subunit S [Nostoc parmelioides]MBD2254462.1 restriction endonuclease subunit S [Nostoc parmelioides FACHB-3921]